jgi:hypothetical protein
VNLKLKNNKQLFGRKPFPQNLVMAILTLLFLIRSLLENAGAVIGERTMQWDMSRLFPGR